MSRLATILGVGLSRIGNDACIGPITLGLIRLDDSKLVWFSSIMLRHELNHPRLNRELGDNELREYLSDKREFSGSGGVTKSRPNLCAYRKGFSRPARVLLISPSIHMHA